MLVDEFKTLFAAKKCVGGSLDGASVNFGGANGIGGANGGIARILWNEEKDPSIGRISERATKCRQAGRTVRRKRF